MVRKLNSKQLHRKNQRNSRITSQPWIHIFTFSLKINIYQIRIKKKEILKLSLNNNHTFISVNEFFNNFEEENIKTAMRLDKIEMDDLANVAYGLLVFIFANDFVYLSR